VGFCTPIGDDRQQSGCRRCRQPLDLLDTARAARVPIAFTTIVPSNPEQPPLWLTKAPALADLAEGSLNVEIDPRLARRDDEPLFHQTGRVGAVGHRSWTTGCTSIEADTVIVCGATTSGCVRATVVDLMQRDLVTLVVGAAVGDRDPAVHAASLADIDAKYADVIDIADAVRVLTGDG
jgi:maleamate amidohydrolase